MAKLEVIWDTERSDWAYRVISGDQVRDAGRLEGDAMLRNLLARGDIESVSTVEGETLPAPWVEMIGCAGYVDSPEPEDVED